MINRFALLLLLILPTTAAHASNLNAESNLVDEGIDPATVQVATLPNGLPLMEGLQIDKDPHFLDILPGGQNNSIRAFGMVDVDDIYNYYKKALPPLGWKAAGGRDYSLNGQSIHIDARAEGKKSVVTFTTRP